MTISHAFDESMVLRGQPANAGQFAAKTTPAPAAALTAPVPGADPHDRLERAAAAYTPLGDFMNEREVMRPDDLVAFLEEPPAADGEGDVDRAEAMRVVSTVLQEHRGGGLRDLRDVWVGEELDMAELWTDEFHTPDRVAAANTDYLTVTRAGIEDAEGTVSLRVRDHLGDVSTVSYPAGTVVPTPVLRGGEWQFPAPVPRAAPARHGLGAAGVA